jgi:hypothetical protein
MTASPPYPSYKLRTELEEFLKGNSAWREQDVSAKVTWCQQHLNPDEWDFDYINCAIIFANKHLLAQFCLAWD